MIIVRITNAALVPHQEFDLWEEGFVFDAGQGDIPR
jgi:hypothetical protein